MKEKRVTFFGPETQKMINCCNCSASCFPIFVQLKYNKLYVPRLRKLCTQYIRDLPNFLRYGAPLVRIRHAEAPLLIADVFLS